MRPVPRWEARDEHNAPRTAPGNRNDVPAVKPYEWRAGDRARAEDVAAYVGWAKARAKSRRDAELWRQLVAALAEMTGART